MNILPVHGSICFTGPPQTFQAEVARELWGSLLVGRNAAVYLCEDSPREAREAVDEFQVYWHARYGRPCNAKLYGLDNVDAMSAEVFANRIAEGHLCQPTIIVRNIARTIAPGTSAGYWAMLARRITSDTRCLCILATHSGLREASPPNPADFDHVWRTVDKTNPEHERENHAITLERPGQPDLLFRSWPTIGATIFKLDTKEMRAA
jgi:hypothetical protein